MTGMFSPKPVLSVRAATLAALALAGCGGAGTPAMTGGGATGQSNPLGGAGPAAGGAGPAAGRNQGGAADPGAAGSDNAPESLNPTDCANPGGIPAGTVNGTLGTWENVTPKEISLVGSMFNNDNFGVQDVLVDPARPSDVYSFVCHQGVWKSTDYGGTWKKVNTGSNGSVIDGGKPWGSGIHSNRCRDPNTPPTLYTLNGNGQMGFWKSVDGGVNWQRTELPAQATTQYPQDAYSIAVDPYDGGHLLMGFHEAVGLVESKDGGTTWQVHQAGDGGVSVYFTFIDTGNAVTTRHTWISLGQSGNMFRTADSGVTWSQVDTLKHAHGCSQLFQAGAGVMYAPGAEGTRGSGVYRSTDFGVTWSKVLDGNANNVIGTPSRLYSSYGWANSGTVEPNLHSAARDPGTSWTAQTAPVGMTNGAKGTAVTSDGSHSLIISGNWNGGLWRYVEP